MDDGYPEGISRFNPYLDDDEDDFIGGIDLGFDEDDDDTLLDEDSGPVFKKLIEENYQDE